MEAVWAAYHASPTGTLTGSSNPSPPTSSQVSMERSTSIREQKLESEGRSRRLVHQGQIQPARDSADHMDKDSSKPTLEGGQNVVTAEEAHQEGVRASLQPLERVDSTVE